MDEFDFKEEKVKKPSRFGAALLNCASLLFLVAAIAVGAYFTLLFLNPQSSLNPFPPVVATETQAPTPTVAAETATATMEPSPTATLEPTPTPEPAIPSRSFGLQAGDNPAAMDSTIFHPDLGCNFMGVAGQVFGLDGLPIRDLQVRVYGTLSTGPIDKVGVTGAATQYGSGEYFEVQLADEPIASENTIQVMVQDADGAPMSSAFTFSTTTSCQANLIMINFAEVAQ